MLERLTIRLSKPERLAVEALAKSELRSVREQIRLIVRQDLQERGLLVPDAYSVGEMPSAHRDDQITSEAVDEDHPAP